jgi:flagellar biosynthesis protein FlhB
MNSLVLGLQEWGIGVLTTSNHLARRIYKEVTRCATLPSEVFSTIT